MDLLLAQLLTGLAYASTLFLVAAGLTIIFGVTRVVNFAHGSLYMLGAYLGYTITAALPATVPGFFGGLLLAALAVAAVGVLVEVAVLRRIYAAPEIFQLLATFGVVLIVQDLALWIWGPEDLFAPRAPGLGGAVEPSCRSTRCCCSPPGRWCSRRCGGCSTARAGASRSAPPPATG